MRMTVPFVLLNRLRFCFLASIHDLILGYVTIGFRIHGQKHRRHEETLDLRA